MKRLNSARGRMVNAFGVKGGYKNEDKEDQPFAYELQIHERGSGCNI